MINEIHQHLKNKNFNISLKEIDRVLKKNKEIYFYNLKSAASINLKKYNLGIKALKNSLNLNSYSSEEKNNMANKSELVHNGGKHKVPCLKIEKINAKTTWLYESDAIIQFLAKETELS